jgi:hypothetical protein
VTRRPSLSTAPSRHDAGAARRSLAVAAILAGWRAYRGPHRLRGSGPAAVSVAVLVAVAAALAIIGATRR